MHLDESATVADPSKSYTTPESRRQHVASAEKTIATTKGSKVLKVVAGTATTAGETTDQKIIHLYTESSDSETCRNQAAIQVKSGTATSGTIQLEADSAATEGISGEAVIQVEPKVQTENPQGYSRNKGMLFNGAADALLVFGFINAYAYAYAQTRTDDEKETTIFMKGK